MVPLVVFDYYGVHKKHKIVEKYLDLEYEWDIIPKGYTGHLQMPDLSMNFEYKRGMKGRFRNWYANKVVAQINNGIKPSRVKVDTKLSTIKNLRFNWMVSSYVTKLAQILYELKFSDICSRIMSAKFVRMI